MNNKQLQIEKGNTLCYPKVTKHVTQKRGFYYREGTFVTFCYRLLPLKTAVFTIKKAVFGVVIHNGSGNNTPFRHKNAKNAVFGDFSSTPNLGIMQLGRPASGEATA